MGQLFQDLKRVQLHRAGLFQEAQQASGLVQAAVSHPRTSHTDAHLGQIRTQREGLLKQRDRARELPNLHQVGRQPHPEHHTFGILFGRLTAKSLRLVVEVKTQQACVQFQCRFRLGLRSVFLHRAGDGQLLGHFPLRLTGHPMPRASRALVDDPLAAQGDHRDKYNHEPQSRVIRFQRGLIPARAGTRPAGFAGSSSRSNASQSR